ncbi:MAG: MBL fold metallo-hydrolase [Actinobacteria bacterium]|nr:MBL fold metallo-hydrolase [Actinomycetota bacterium]
MRVDILETPDLGDRSYVVSDGSVALVVDPQRDLDRVEALVVELGVQVRMVVETHLHNDYVTGGHALARRTGATYVVAGRDDVAFERCAAHDLYGSVGRTDLLGTDRTDDLTRKQFGSARRLAKALPDESALYPTHGFGSFCSSGGASGGSDSTIGQEKSRNDALTEDDEQAFVDKLVAGLTGYPAYYAHMSPLNAQGPDEPDLTPARTVDPVELAARIRTGEWVVDLRDRAAYAGRHLAGTVSIGIGKQFSTYAGWVIPWGAPITLIGENPEQVAEAQRQLVRIGIDRLAGSATGDLHSLAADVPVRSYPSATFADVPAEARVLDVRRDDEAAGGHIRGAKHIPLHSLVDRLHEVPQGRVWVHCASGFRASIAASILDRAGHEVVHLDDDFSNAEKAGLAVSRP